LIVLCKCVTSCRQHCQTESQTRYYLEITNCEQIDWHSRPLNRPALRSSAKRLAALESIIIVSTRMPILQDSQPSLHRNFCIQRSGRDRPSVCETRWTSPLCSRLREFEDSANRAPDLIGRGVWPIGPVRWPNQSLSDQAASLGLSRGLQRVAIVSRMSSATSKPDLGAECFFECGNATHEHN